MPATIGSRRRLEPSSLRVSTTTRVGSPMRPGTTAEAITPIIVARVTASQGIGVSGSAARSVSCQEIERSTSEHAISTNASATQPGLAVIRAWPMRCRPRRESAKASSPASRIAATTTPARLCRGPPASGPRILGERPLRGVYQSRPAVRARQAAAGLARLCSAGARRRLSRSMGHAAEPRPASSAPCGGAPGVGSGGDGILISDAAAIGFQPSVDVMRCALVPTVRRRRRDARAEDRDVVAHVLVELDELQQRVDRVLRVGRRQRARVGRSSPRR